MSDQFEVMSPWADVDPLPLRGLSPRLNDLSGKTVGLYANSKIAAMPMLDMVEEKFKERFPGVKFTRFERLPNLSVAETNEWEHFQEWVKGVDAVVLSHGD